VRELSGACDAAGSTHGGRVGTARPVVSSRSICGPPAKFHAVTRRLGRRAVLSALATGPLAGCALPGDRRATPTGTADPVTLPYASDDPAENVDRARGFSIQNRTGAEHFVTVAVDAPERTLFVETRTVDPWGVFRTGDVVRKRGVYRVVIETAAGDRAVHGWVVWPGIEGLDAFLDESGLRTVQSVFCGPDCRPLSAGGESTDLPYRAPDADRSTRTAALSVRNATTTEQAITVGIADRDRRVLDYEYSVPPGVGVQLPITRTPGVLDLRLAADGETYTERWHVPEEQRVRFTVGAARISPDCRDRTPGVAVTRVRNEDGDPHRVRIEISADGDLVAGRSYDLPPRSSLPEVTLGRVSGNESDESTATSDPPTGNETTDQHGDGAGDPARTLPATTVDAGRYDIRIVVDGSRERTATWTVCYPDDELTVEVDADGAPQLFSPTRGLIRL
jgi:hypothetical protein